MGSPKRARPSALRALLTPRGVRVERGDAESGFGFGFASARPGHFRARRSRASGRSRARAVVLACACALVVALALGRGRGRGGGEDAAPRTRAAAAATPTSDAPIVERAAVEVKPVKARVDVDDGASSRAVVTASDASPDSAALPPLEEELERARRRGGRSPPSVASASVTLDPKRIRTVSLNNPRAFLYEGFLTEDEAAHLLELSKGRLHKSGVVDAKTGSATMSDVRTSTGTFISRNHDAVVSAIEARIELWAQIPQSHHEAFQVLRYEPGQEYKAHFDYFFHKGGMRNNRIATVLLYLTDVEEGGETTFPNTDVPTSRDASKYSACGNGGRGVKARRGDALLFWSMKPGGELDAGSSHAGCPVIKGEKWTATKWMHVNPLGAPGEETHKVFYDGGPRPTPDCDDAQDACRGWAEGGECDKNPGFMHVSCRMSCRLCVGEWRDGGYDKPPEKDKKLKSPTTT